MQASRRLYLAYGSNLSKQQMLARCPRSLPLAAATIRGWQLNFFGLGTERWGPGGVASLVPAAGATAYGALYELTAADELRLDGFEGVPDHYSKHEDFARYLSGVELARGCVVYAYLVCDTSRSNPPSRRYLDVIRAGFQDWGLPLAALAGIQPQPEAASPA